ncbi:MAG: hypothetical protein WD749_08265 [Phycisphaerales bacterium]
MKISRASVVMVLVGVGGAALVALGLAAPADQERAPAPGGAQAAGVTPPPAPPGGPAPANWIMAEAPVLTGPVQLTSRERFIKAGEAYFGPKDWIIFQAVPVPAEGKDPDPFYSMYVAKLTRGADGRISGLEEPIRVSAEGSANTCGWFHPKLPGTVMFGSTITPPSSDQKAGFQVGTRRYEWLFPQEMEIVTTTVPQVFADVAGKPARRAPLALPPAAALFERPGYDAEGSYSPDGRFILYAHVREDTKPEDRADVDLWVYDTRTGAQHAIVAEQGYDGGPFFSPDGRSICYRSDRKLNDKLQLFVADLRFDAGGVPVGVEREHQLTDNGAVNWAPFWHPSGSFLAYGTSELGHFNYEVFAIEVDRAKLAADGPGSRAAETLRRGRVTHAPGADVLPVFNSDGDVMMWTGQRGPMVPGEQRPSSQLWAADFDAAALTLDIVGAAPVAPAGAPSGAHP